MPEMAVETIAVEPTMVMNRMVRRATGLFINRNLDNTCQNYAKLKFNTKFILPCRDIQLLGLDQEHGGDRSLPFFIRRFDGLQPVY